jgi:hypothetical protein
MVLGRQDRSGNNMALYPNAEENDLDSFNVSLQVRRELLNFDWRKNECS